MTSAKLILFAAIFMLGIASATTTQSDCGFLNTANETYVMNQSITSAAASTCITINNTNITLDCSGFTITGDNTSSKYGIHSTKNFTSIMNCANITNFANAIYLDTGANNWKINNVSAYTSESSSKGLENLIGASYGSLSNSTFYSKNNVGMGIYGGYINITNVIAISDIYYGTTTSGTNNIFINLTSKGLRTNAIGYGLNINNAKFSQFINCTASSNSTYPIYVQGTSNYNNNITNPTLIVAAAGSTGSAIYNSGGKNLTIDCLGGNIIGNNLSTSYGIRSDSYNTTIQNCNISNFESGILLTGSSANYSTIKNCNISSTNNYPIYFLNAIYNTVNNCSLTTSRDHGFVLSGASDNIIINSRITITVTTTTKYALSITGATARNLIYNNIFNATNKNVEIVNDVNSTNFWNTTLTLGTNIVGGPNIGGNWYSNYTGTDVGGDGIVDIPYNITPGGDIDYLPLANYTPIPPPAAIVNITSPTNTTYTTATPVVNVTCYGNFTEYLLNVTNNGAIILANQLVNNNTAYNFSNTTFTEGSHTLNATCWNGTYNNYSTVSFSLDTINPTVQFVTPTTNSSTTPTTNNNILVNVTATDTNLNNITIRLYNRTDGALLNTTNTATSPNYVNYSGLGDGEYAINATAYDILGQNNKTETRNITIDRINPAINIVSPTSNSSTTPTTDNNILVNVTATDTNLNNVTVRLYNASSGALLNTTNSATSPNYVNYSGLANGNYSINATSYDTAGNGNKTETRNITIDRTNPTISIVSPTTNSSTTPTTNNDILVNVTATDTYLNNVTVRLYNASNGALLNTTNTATSPNYINYSGLANGNYSINATAYDTAGNSNKTETRNITIDRTNPTVQFVVPTTNSSAVLTVSSVISNVTATDTNLLNVTTSFYNLAGALLSSSISTYNAFNGFADGYYRLNATSYDTAGNHNDTETRTIAIDTGTPTVSFVSPTIPSLNSVFKTGYILVNASVVSTFNISNITIYFYNSTGGLIFNTTQSSTATFYYYNWSSLPSGQLIYYNASATDIYNKTGYSVDTRQITIVDFNLSLLSYPADFTSQLSPAMNITYNITFIYPAAMTLNCSLYQDTLNKGSNSITSSGNKSTIGTFDIGLHTWYIDCVESTTLGNKSSAPHIININNITNYSGSIFLANASNITAGSQNLFYDILGNLNLIYFTNNSGTSYINYYSINATTGSIFYEYHQPLNQTKPFFVAMRDNNNVLKILTFSKDNSTYHVLLINSTLMEIHNYTDTYWAKVTSNSYWDPYKYAYNSQFNTLSLTANKSSYVFVIPMSNVSEYVRMFVGNESIQRLYSIPYKTYNASSFAGSWGTIANDSYLENWIVNNYTIGTSAKGNLSTYYINSTDTTLDAAKLILEDTNIKGANTAWNTSKLYYEYDDVSIYQVYLNTTHMRITRLSDLVNVSFYNISNPITNPSTFIFIDNNTFSFLSNETDGNIMYSCYFGGGISNCTRVKQTQYGMTLTYFRGNMESTYHSPSYKSTYGIVSSTAPFTQLSYVNYIYSSKFICWDEMAEYRKPFVMNILSGNKSGALIVPIFGYTIEDSFFQSGLQQAYSQCLPNGTVRLSTYSVTSSSFLDMYSLQIPNGAYYTFNTKSIIGSVVQGAIITAYRISPQFSAFVPIEQGISDSTGSATLYLQPLVSYQIIVTSNGYAAMTFAFTPVGTTLVNIVINPNLPNYTIPGYSKTNDVIYKSTPGEGLKNVSFTPQFWATSPGGMLEDMNQLVWRTINGSTVLYSNVTILSPNGGTINGLAIPNDTTADYVMKSSFKVFNQSRVYVTPVHYYINPLSPMNYVFNNIANIVDGWTYYLIATFAAILVGGFASRYTLKGAGLVACGVLWVFTMVNPAAVVATIGAVAITTLMATIIATVFAVIAYMGMEVL